MNQKNKKIIAFNFLLIILLISSNSHSFCSDESVDISHLYGEWRLDTEATRLRNMIEAPRIQIIVNGFDFELNVKDLSSTKSILMIQNSSTFSEIRSKISLSEFIFSKIDLKEYKSEISDSDLAEMHKCFTFNIYEDSENINYKLNIERTVSSTSSGSVSASTNSVIQNTVNNYLISRDKKYKNIKVLDHIEYFNLLLSPMINDSGLKISGSVDGKNNVHFYQDRTSTRHTILYATVQFSTHPVDFNLVFKKILTIK